MRRSIKNLFKRGIVLGLSALMLIGDVPLTSYNEVSAATADYAIWTYDKDTGVSKEIVDYDGNAYVSDSNTINGWKNYLKEDSTEYAGAVWTDKAVFTNDTASTAIPDDFRNMNKAVVQKSGTTVDKDSDGNIVMTTEANAYDATVTGENFLVSMSALGSTKQITGYSSLPSDTVFILDLSNSMSSEDLRKMVEATNKAIHQLLTLNQHNRVGIVVYGTDSYSLLPIGRYSTTKSDANNTADISDDYPVYIEISGGSGGYDQSSQIVTARTTATTTTTTTQTANEISESTWDTIINDLPDGDDYNFKGGDRGYRQDVAEYLERVLSTTVVGFDVNWSDELRELAGEGPNSQNLRNWSDSKWEEALKQIISENKTVTKTTTTTTINLKDSAETDVLASVNIGGATYMQGGINSAKELFEAMAGDTTIDTGLIQGGTARLPITVLMTDGAPTYASVDYTDADNGENALGEGGTSSIGDGLVFPTQLSAALLSKTMQELYGREALIYTLGLGIEYAEAHRVLNPFNNTSDTINSYWTSYEGTAQNSEISGYTYTEGQGGQRTYKITRAEGTADTLTNYRYYVDEYFAADDSSDLVNAFNSIVEAIVIQSKYYPTLVEAGAHDFDGYLTFEDEIGEFMEVKDIKGIALGDTIYTGQAFLDALNNSDAFGNASTWTAYGEELLKSISERIGIAENEARSLLAAAYRAGGVNADGTPANNIGQLWKENYIGWYADASGNYLGHWDDELHTEVNYPEGTEYLNKCYIFQGDLSGTSTSVRGGDMMHIVVQVHEEVETGHQCVIWKIPANLIPLVTYEITVDSNSLDTAETITVNFKEEEPIRLLYEVGLVEEINDANMMDVVGAADHSHPVKDDSGKVVGYAFYSNRWGAGHTPDGSGSTDVLDPTANLATVSHFHPSEQNERYYYTEDSIIYAKTDSDTYEVYKGEKPSGDDYWHVYRIIEKDNSGNCQIRNKYVSIDAAVLSASGAMEIQQITDTTDENYGAWYVPAGQIYQQIARHQQEKADANTTGAGKDGTVPEAKGNVTATLRYYDYPVIVSGEGDDYNIYDFLGNNGRLVKFSATGIKLAKSIDDNTAAGTQTFDFTVALTAPNGGALQSSYPTVLTAVDGTQTSGTVNVNNGIINVSIKNGESIYIIGLEAGTFYRITESKHAEYAVKEVKVNGTAQEEKAASGTAVQFVIDNVEFINMMSSHKGNLEVSKTVTHPYGEDYAINSSLVFDVIVDLDTPNANKTFKATGTVNNGIAVSSTLTTDADGKIELKLGHEDSVTIYEIKEDTIYEVTEDLSEMPQGWNRDLYENGSTGLDGTIVSDTTVEAKLVNKLILQEEPPADTSNIDIEITKKIMKGTSELVDWQDGWTFDFEVEKYERDASGNGIWRPIQDDPVTATENQKTVTIYGAEDGVARLTFGANDLGEHYYRITEQVGSIEGITYDTTHRYFYLVVSDVNTDGVIEVEAKNYFGTTVTTTDGKTKVAAEFTNYYDSAVAQISLTKELINDTGIDVSMDSFTFEFCSAKPAGEGTDEEHVCLDESKHLTLKANVDGKLTFHQDYTEDDLKDVECKTVSGGDLSGGDLSGNNASGTSQEIKSKTFTYYLWEKAGNIPGMDYDESVWQVDVVVTVTMGTPSNSISVTSVTATKIKDGDGDNIDELNLVAETADFTNSYVLDKDVSAQVTIEKTLTGGRNIAKGEFSFELYKTHANFSTTGVTPTTVQVGSGSYDENTSTAAATATFDLLTDASEKKSGTYYYVIKEQAGTNAAITYDPAVYHVTVVVGAKDGKLEVESVTVNKVGGETTVYPTDKPDEIKAKASFTNAYKIVQNAVVTIKGDKDLSGKNLSADEYTFGLYEDEACTEPVMVGGEAVTAGNLVTSGAFTFTLPEYANITDADGDPYYIKEIIPAEAQVPDYKDEPVKYDKSVYKVVVKVTDTNGDGVLEAGQTMTRIRDAEGNAVNEAAEVAKFTNIFTPDPVTVSFTGEKQYVNSENKQIAVSDWPAEGFAFELYPADSNFNPVSNTAAATVNSGYTFAGEWDAATSTFIRTSLSVSTPTEFAAPFALNLTFPTAGSYYFVLREVEGTASSVRYDTKEYHLTVIVTDYGNGTLVETTSMTYNGRVVEAGKPAEFKNELIEQKVDVQVKITKDFTNNTGVTIPYSAFQLGLYEDDACTKLAQWDGQDLISAASSTGDASFNFQFDNDELESGASSEYTHTYYAKEIVPNDAPAGMTYDQSVYKVVITLRYVDGVLDGYDTITQIVDKNGNPIASADQAVDSDNEMTFQNKYELDATEIIITGTKALTGRDIVDGEFAFALYEATVTTDAANAITGWTVGTQIGENVTNTGTLFSFPRIAYSSVGTYYYVIQEKVPAQADANIAYDQNEYLVTVDVIDKGDGTLGVAFEVVGKRRMDADQAVYTWATNEAPLSLTFENVFTPEPIGVLIEGTKTLAGRTLDKAGEFTFELYETGSNYVIEAGSTPLKSVKNIAGETENIYDRFVFEAAKIEGTNDVNPADRLYFAEEDTRYFVVKEVEGSDPTITYDAAEHNIKVVVTKNAKGNLAAHVEEVNSKKSTVEIQNTYTAKEASATVNIKKNLINETGVDYDITKFTYGVYTDEACQNPYSGTDVAVSATDSHGNATVTFMFTDNDYSLEAGAVNTEIFYIKEIDGKVPKMIYDGSIYRVELKLSYHGSTLVAAPTITKIVDGDRDLADETNSVVLTADFRNVYDLGAAAVNITGSKSYDGWSAMDADETFTVELYKTGELGNYAEDGVLIGKTTVSKENPGFTFTKPADGVADTSSVDAVTSELEFTSAGTYYFVVREEHGGLTQNDIIYDGKQYVVRVDVTPDSQTDPTALVADVHTYLYGHDSAADAAVEFTNITLSGKTTVDIIGKKQLTDEQKIGKEIGDHDQEFDFELYKAGSDWKVAENAVPFLSTVNREKAADQDNDGYNVEFCSVPLEYAGGNVYDHYFVLREMAGSNPTITYDDTEYRIKIVGKFVGESSEKEYVIDTVQVWKTVKDKDDSITWKEIPGAYNGTEGQIICIDGNANKNYSFTNDYTPKYTDADTHTIIPIEKVLINETGVSMTKEGFRFGLYYDAAGTDAVEAVQSVEAGLDVYTPDTGSRDVVVVSTDAEGNATIRLRFSDTMYDAVKDHTYTYYVKEIAGSVAGMEYDKAVYEVKVVLSYNDKKELITDTTITEVSTSSISTRSAVAEARFHNTYELDPADVSLSGVKELEGHDALKSDFVFSLYKADVTEGRWTIDESAAPITTTNDYKADAAVSGNDYDKFVFSEITLDKAGTYHYIVRENAGKLGGVTYDESEYRVTVDVFADDADGVDSDGDNAMNDLVANVTVEKYDAEGNLLNHSVDNDNDGVQDIVFNNTYVPKGSFSISGTKKLVKRDWLDDDAYTFYLYETDESFAVAEGAIPKAASTVKGTVADKSFVFKDVEIIDDVKHYFVIREASGGVDMMKFDTSEYRVTIDTVDNLDGTMKVGRYEGKDSTADPQIFVENEFDIQQVDITKKFLFFRSVNVLNDDVAMDEIVFVNEYLTNPVSAVINGTKNLTSNASNREIQDDEFTFKLYKADLVYDSSQGGMVWTIGAAADKTVTNKGAGFEFTADADAVGDVLTFTQTGDYYFIVKEAAGDHDIIAYDTAEHRIKVQVTDLGDTDNDNKANLKAEVFYLAADGTESALTDQLAFNNHYNDTKVTFDIVKTVKKTGDMDHTAAGFKFKLKNVTTGTVYEPYAVSDSNGKTSYTINYDETAIGKTFEYQISEVDTDIKDMTYDRTVYTVKVALTVENGRMKAAVELDGVSVDDVEVNFTNTYNGTTPKEDPVPEPETPDPEDTAEPGTDVVVDNIPKTGDDSNTAWYIALAAACAVLLAILLFLRKKNKAKD